MNIAAGNRTHEAPLPSGGLVGAIASTRVLVRLATQGTWAVADQALFALSNFALNMLLARWLSPGDYGAFGVAFSIYLFLGVLHTAFLTEPMLIHGSSDRYRPWFGAYLKVLLREHVKFSLIAMVVLLTVAMGLALYSVPSFSRSLFGLAFMSPLALLLWLARRACYALLVPRLAASGGALYMIIIAGGIAVLNERGWLSPATAFGVIGVGSFVSSAWLLSRVFLRSGSQEGESELQIRRTHFEYGRWAAPTSVLSWITGATPVFLLPLWGGLESVAVLKALINPLLPMQHVITSLSVLLVPGLVRRGRGSSFAQLVNLAMTVFLAGGAIYAAFLVFFAGPLVNWMYGGRYDTAARWLPFLTPLLLTSGVSSAFSGALRAANRPDLLFKAYACSAVTALVLAVPLLRHGGIGGAVLLMLITAGVTAIMLVAGRRRIENWHVGSP